MNNFPPSIGIIGEGKMGTNIFHYLLDFGFPMIWVSNPKIDLEKIQKSFQKKLKRSLDAGILDETGFFFRTKNIRITNQLTDLSNCDLIIEAVTEDLQLKQEIFIEIDAIAHPDCIFATNSSSIKPSGLYPSIARSDKFIGLHFFYPVSLKNIVELIITSQTSLETVDYAKRFLSTIQRDHLQLDEKNSFALNKIFLSFQNEAFLIVSEGKATIRQMDDLIKENFFPFGAFDFMDSVGIPTMLASIVNYSKDYPDRAAYKPLILRLQAMSDKGTIFSHSDVEDQVNMEQLLLKEILNRLQIALKEAIAAFTESAGLASEKMVSALNEYFGVDITKIIGMNPE